MTTRTWSAPPRGRDRGRWIVAGAALAVAVAATSSTPLRAQGVDRATFGVVAGAARYDIAGGEGTAPFAGIRLTLPLHRYIVVEPGFTWAPLKGADDRSVTVFIGEVQLLGQYPTGDLRPYAGIGVGGALDFRENRTGLEEFLVLSYTAGGGVRYLFSDHFEGRGEIRARGLDGFELDTVEFGLGIAVVY